MNISVMGRASAYVKSCELNMKWQKRKQNPMKVREDEDPQVSELKKRVQEQKKSNAILSLQNKLLSGMNLTAEEMEYLRENSPEDYEKAIKLERERAEYKRELRECRSKEDVEKLNMQKLQRFGAEAKSIRSNPIIPEAKKKELLDFLHMRMKAFMDEYAKFVNTLEYQRLPEKDDREEIVSFTADETVDCNVSDPDKEQESESDRETFCISNSVKPSNFTPYNGSGGAVKRYILTDMQSRLYSPIEYGGFDGRHPTDIEA